MSSSSNLKIGWYDNLKNFVQTERNTIIEKLRQHEFEQFLKNSSQQQISAWENSIEILQEEFKNLIVENPNSSQWIIIFEYILPREGGRRPDVILLTKNHVVIFEFKDFKIIKKSHVDQVLAYARDIKTYHHMSHDMSITPILIATRFRDNSYKINNVVILNKNDISSFVNNLVTIDETYQNPLEWINSDYLPLPSILQAAKIIFQHENFPKIKSAQSAGIPQTIEKLLEIVRIAKKTNSNHLALVTGVPGSGKTLVGLQFVYTLDKLDQEINGVFLSGNGPLVEVLRYALGRESKSFVQPVHNFLKEYGGKNMSVPHENVWVYDEAQRAWDSERVLEKRGHVNSEPDDFIELGDRINSWSLVVGLIGEGQHIHIGEEAGLILWKNAIEKSKKKWNISCPKKLADIFAELNPNHYDELDLTKTLRSHIAENVSLWISKLIDGKISDAQELSVKIRRQGFELYITRELEYAKSYVRERYDGQDEKRYGIIASSKATILQNFGIKNDWSSTQRVKTGPWYNDSPNSEKSCCALTQVVTEFSCQGLELDMPIVGWGDDLIWDNGWKTFSKRSKAKDPHALRLNSYRVLLSRGRDGIIVFIPNVPKLHSTYKFLIDSGLMDLPTTQE